MIEIKPHPNGIIRSHPQSHIRMFIEGSLEISNLFLREKPYVIRQGVGAVDVVILQAVKIDDKWLIEYMYQCDFMDTIKEQ